MTSRKKHPEKIYTAQDKNIRTQGEPNSTLTLLRLLTTFYFFGGEAGGAAFPIRSLGEGLFSTICYRSHPFFFLKIFHCPSFWNAARVNFPWYRSTGSEESFNRAGGGGQSKIDGNLLKKLVPLHPKT